MTKNCKYLIIGGGVSGLTFANFINTDDYLILEKENEPGGYCRTIYQDGYVWDYAGHFFHFATERVKNIFKNRINPDELIYKDKCTKIFYKNIIIDFPFQANIHQLEKEEYIDCLYDLYFRKKQESESEFNSFLDMLYGKFGISITEKFLRPYNEKLYACNLNSLDKDAMGRFFPYADLEQVIKNFKGGYSGSYNSQFMYPKNGAKIFVDALAQNINNDKILLNEFVVAIDSAAKIAMTNLGREISYEFLINSSPLNKFLTLFKNRTDYTEVADNLSWNKVLVFNLGFSKKSWITDIHWAYLPDKSVNFYRIGFYDNILDSDKLSMYVEIGLAADETADIEEQLRLTLENLKNIGVINEDNKLLSYSTIVMDPAYVHVDSKLENLKAVIKADFESHDIYSIGRYGDWKYCSIEDSMIDALSVADKLNSNNLN